MHRRIFKLISKGSNLETCAGNNSSLFIVSPVTFPQIAAVPAAEGGVVRSGPVNMSRKDE